jgi:hypothetical protein
MAAAADTAEGFSTSRSGRALAFGCSFAACLLAAGALTITLLGHPGGPPAIKLELAQDPASRTQARRASALPVPTKDPWLVRSPNRSMPARRCWPIRP